MCVVCFWLFRVCSAVGRLALRQDSEGPGEALRSAYDSSAWVQPVLFRGRLRSPCDVDPALCASILRRTGKVVGCLSASGRVNFGSEKLEWVLTSREGRSTHSCLPADSRVATSRVTWLILPVVICLSQRLSHACLSTSLTKVKPRMAH